MYLDKTIGQLVDYLEEEGWLDNSVIVVASDNGGCAPDGGSNVPLRGVKNSYWEGGVKVRKNMFGRNVTEDAGYGKKREMCLEARLIFLISSALLSSLGFGLSLV